MTIFYKINPSIKHLQNGTAIYYIGYDYNFVNELKNSGLKVIDTRSLLNLMMENLKSDLINYVAENGKRQKNLSIWWSSNIASKFNLNTRFFDRLILIKSAEELIKRNDGSVIIVSDYLVYLILKKNFNQFRYHIYDSIKVFAELLKSAGRNLLSFLKNRIWFMISIIHYNYSAPKRSSNSVHGSIFLYSWLEGRSFNVNGKYDDVYLPGIYDLENEKMCLLFPYYAKVEYLRSLRSNERFISLSEQSSIGFILKSLFVFFRAKVNFNFMGLNVRLLWASEIMEENSSYNFISRYHEFLVWKKFFHKYTGKIIYPYENQPWEKLMLLASHESKKNNIFIAYQHSTIGKYQLNYHTTRAELEYMPVPDIILVNTDDNVNVFKNMYDSKDIVIKNAGALRFNNNRLFKPLAREKSFKTIGVILPINKK
ncbi:MAG: hypothetical protein ACFFDN_23045, partial [Candidatus Hodarchaeota archaeon]